MEKLICPACGSENLTKKEYEDLVCESLGESKLVQKVLYICNDCESEGDFFNENEAIIKNSLVELKNQLATSILDGLNKHRISLSAMERALELPQRTLTKWKTGASNPTASGIAMLKFLKLFPWLLEVAENKFDFNLSQKIFLSHAFKTMIENLDFQDSFKEAGMITTANSSLLYIHLEKQEEKERVHQIEPHVRLIAR